MQISFIRQEIEKYNAAQEKLAHPSKELEQTILGIKFFLNQLSESETEDRALTEAEQLEFYLLVFSDGLYLGYTGKSPSPAIALINNLRATNKMALNEDLANFRLPKELQTIENFKTYQNVPDKKAEKSLNSISFQERTRDKIVQTINGLPKELDPQTTFNNLCTHSEKAETIIQAFCKLSVEYQNQDKLNSLCKESESHLKIIICFAGLPNNLKKNANFDTFCQITLDENRDWIVKCINTLPTKYQTSINFDNLCRKYAEKASHLYKAFSKLDYDVLNYPKNIEILWDKNIATLEQIVVCSKDMRIDQRNFDNIIKKTNTVIPAKSSLKSKPSNNVAFEKNKAGIIHEDKMTVPTAENNADNYEAFRKILETKIEENRKQVASRFKFGGLFNRQSRNRDYQYQTISHEISQPNRNYVELRTLVATTAASVKADHKNVPTFFKFFKLFTRSNLEKALTKAIELDNKRIGAKK